MSTSKINWFSFGIMLLSLGVLGFSIYNYVQPPINRYLIERSDTILLQEYHYEAMVDSIKKYEGFRDTVYICPGGQPTIGYGHAIRSGDPTVITMHQGDSILRSDLDWGIKRAHELTGLTGNKLLAVGSFIFNSGIGSFVRSRMYQKILKGENIDAEWDKWHTVNGVHSDHIFRFRQYQKKLYNSN